MAPGSRIVGSAGYNRVAVGTTRLDSQIVFAAFSVHILAGDDPEPTILTLLNSKAVVSTVRKITL